MSYIKELLHDIREFFWPILEPLEPQKVEEIKIADCNWGDSEIDIVAAYLNEYRNSEEDRKKQIESKSTIFIGTFSVAATVLANFLKGLVVDTQGAVQFPGTYILIITMTLAIIYLCRAIWFSIKALERQKYYSIGFPKFLLSNEENKRKRMIVNIYNNIKKNQEVINLKADYMMMAQLYFKRAVITVVIASIEMLIMSSKSFVQLFLEIAKVINNTNISIKVIVLLFVLIIILFVWICKINKKVKDISNK